MKKNWYIVSYYWIDNNGACSALITEFLYSIPKEAKLVINIVKCIYNKHSYDSFRVKNVVKLGNDGKQKNILDAELDCNDELRCKIQKVFNDKLYRKNKRSLKSMLDGYKARSKWYNKKLF